MDTLDSSDSLGLGVREERSAMDEVVFVKGKPIMLDQREALEASPRQGGNKKNQKKNKAAGNQKKIPEDASLDEYVSMPDAIPSEDPRQSDEDWASSLAMKANQEIDRVREKTARGRRAKSMGSAADGAAGGGSYMPPGAPTPHQAAQGSEAQPRQWL